MSSSTYHPIQSSKDYEYDDTAPRISLNDNDDDEHNHLTSNGFIPATVGDDGEVRGPRDSRLGHRPKTPSFDSSPEGILARKRLWWKNAIVNAMFMGSWYVFATVLSLYNKWMFSPDKFGFPSPLFVTTMHMFVQFSLAALLRSIRPDLFRPPRSPNRDDYIKRALPTAISTGLDIGLSNLSLKTITLSFYTMCKSSSLIFVLLFAFLFRLEHFSLRLIAVIFLIFVGVLLMVTSETAFVLSGMLLVLSASAFGGLRWALTQLLLVGRKGKEMGMDTPVASIYWLAPSMGISLGLLSLVIEGWGTLFASEFFDGWWFTLRTIGAILAPGVVAFVMVLSEFYIIQRVGIVPMSVAGIFKEVSTISLSAWAFGDDITPVNIVGVGITTIGIGLFTFHKYQNSINSPVALDAHGNPIDKPIARVIGEEDDLDGESIFNVDEEAQPLAMEDVVRRSMEIS